MLTWLAENAATILISAVILVVVGLIIRGMVRGKIKTCGDCGSCSGACASERESAGCGACPFSGNCRSGNGA